MWRLVKEKVATLSEMEDGTYSLHDIYKMNDVLDMEQGVERFLHPPKAED